VTKTLVEAVVIMFILQQAYILGSDRGVQYGAAVRSVQQKLQYI
jgi:hypothetical protein